MGLLGGGIGLGAVLVALASLQSCAIEAPVAKPGVRGSGMAPVGGKDAVNSLGAPGGSNGAASREAGLDGEALPLTPGAATGGARADSDDNPPGSGGASQEAGGTGTSSGVVGGGGVGVDDSGGGGSGVDGSGADGSGADGSGVGGSGVGGEDESGGRPAEETSTGGVPAEDDLTAPSCGNSRLDPGEECDNGSDNSDFAPDACRTDCTQARCGDGTVDQDEQCDGAALGGQNCASQDFDFGELRCSATCRYETSECAANRCGDGVKFGAEQCDDGDNNSDFAPDACRTDCSRPVCGDGVMDSNEACDGSLPPGVSCTGLGFDFGTLACRACAVDTSSCQLTTCGDGIVSGNEECDDGNTIAGDGCEPDTCVKSPDLMSFAAELNGHTILLPCGTFTSIEVCTPVNIGRTFTGDPGLQGFITHYAELTFGGDPGRYYEVTVAVRGLVESKTYSGGVDADSSGSQIPANGLYIGGAPDNNTNGYNVYRLRTESPAQNYFLNSVGVPGNTRMCHCVFDTDYEFTFEVEGGSKLILSSADPNNSATANCGIASDNSCAGTEVSLTNLDPLIANAIGEQPYNGQFLGFVVLDVKALP